MPSVPPKAKLTAQQKERIAYLAQSGMSVTDIAKELNIHGQQVAGYTRTLLNFGPKVNPPSPTSPEMESMPNQNLQSDPAGAAPQPQYQPAGAAPPPQPHYQQPAPAPAPQYQQPAPPPDGFAGGRPAFGYSQGFTNPAQTVRYQIERKMPADGIVGFHTGHFTEADLCQNYGEGLYRVLRFEPGRPQPFEFEVKVGPAFGPPRNPKYGSSAAEARGGERPGLQRPYTRPWESRGEEDGAPPPPPRPAPYYDRGQDRSLYEFARGNQAQAAAASDVTAEAIRQLGDANKRALDQAENARKGGPDAFVTNFFQQQQDMMVRRMEEDRKGIEQRRREDDERWEKRQREVETEYKRRQTEEETKHNRDLERLRIETEARAKAAAEERKTLLELEDKKLALIREEGKLRQDMLAEELKNTRNAMEKMTERTAKEVQEMREQTSKDIENSNASIQATLEKDREALEREHKLKEKSLDKEHELSKQILDIKQEALSNQGGDQIFNLLQTLVKEASKGLEKIVDLQRLQSMTPDAQVAHVAGGAKSEPVDANVPVEPKRSSAAAAQPEMAGAGTNGNGNGHAAQEAAAEEDGEKLKMEQIVQAMVEQPAFKQVIKEWSRQVAREEDPTTFANMYLEWMRDPVDSESRKGCSMFANFMKTRSWDEMLAVIGPKLDKDVLKIFKTPFAAEFYEGFKAMVIEQVRAYWEDFMASRKAAQAAKTVSEPAPAAAAPEPTPAAEPEPTQVPTRIAAEKK